MPRGYLKHNKDVARKVSRGGGSNRSKEHGGRRGSKKPKVESKNSINSFCRKTKTLVLCADNDLEAVVSSENDIVLFAPPLTSQTTRENSTKHSSRSGSGAKSKIAACAICLEVCPVIRLLNQCVWHPEACISCLQQHYFDYTINSVTKFPVQCFYPGCDATLRDHQLKQLEPSDRELDVYYRNSVLSKAYQSTRRTVVHCPTCQHPRQFTKSNKPSEHIICYKGCQGTYYAVTNGKSLDAIVLDQATLQAAEMMGYFEGTGQRDGWGLCPKCNILISGGDLLDDEAVFCVCDSEIVWEEATKRVKRIRRHIQTTV